MACKNRYSGSVDKCKNITQHSYDLVENNINEITDVKIDGNLLGVINNAFVSPLTDEEICKYLKALKNVERNTLVEWSTRATKEAKTALEDAEKALCKNLKKPTCEESLANDPDLQAAKAECDSDPTKTWSMTRCECRASSSNVVVNEPEKEIYGCLDKDADNFYCLTNDCVDNKPPKNVKDLNCEYSREMKVENIYLFCNNKNGCGQDDTTDEGWISPTTDIATWIDNGAIDNKHISQVKKGMKQLIDKITPNYLFLKTKKGFYRQQFPESLKNELANALTVASFKTKFKKNSDSTFPFTRVTVYSRDSKPMGQFSIVPKTGKNGEMDGIGDMKSHSSASHLRKRLRDEIGSEILDASAESNYNQALNNWNVGYTIKDGKVVKKTVTEGLGLVLQKEQIGLAKLLK